MANSFNPSNITNKVMRAFLKRFESSLVLCKTIDTQLYDGEFTPQFGDKIRIKRPLRYKTIRTSDGDLTGESAAPIIVGNAFAEVQDFITVYVELSNKDEALEADQLEELLNPTAIEVVTELENSLATFMRTNVNLSTGTPGTAVTTWEQVANSGALMQSIGVPAGDWYYVMNPYTQTKLASAQSGLLADKLVTSAWERAQISMNFGGMRAISSNALSTFTNGTCADRAGTLAATPSGLYTTYKDTMIQTLSVAGFTAGGVIAAGEVVEITGRYYLNQSTRNTVVDAAGTVLKFRGVVTETATMNSSGAGSIKIAGPGIYEATGAYNTVSAALTSGDVITVLGSSAATVAPNLFFHKQAFSLASVKLPKLNTWDTVAKSQSGFSCRVTKFSDGVKNMQQYRIDMLPAFACNNPFFGGLGYGS